MGCCRKVYTLPTFNLLATVFDGTMLGLPGPARLTTICQLQWGDLGGDIYSPPTVNTTFGKMMYGLFPKLTDLRTVQCGPLIFNDFVAIPAGSTRLYQVMYVDDRWKGFATEHRMALLLASVGPGFPGWAVPIT